jgi:hypothetical protein
MRVTKSITKSWARHVAGYEIIKLLQSGRKISIKESIWEMHAEV